MLAHEYSYFLTHATPDAFNHILQTTIQHAMRAITGFIPADIAHAPNISLVTVWSTLEPSFKCDNEKSLKNILLFTGKFDGEEERGIDAE